MAARQGRGQAVLPREQITNYIRLLEVERPLRHPQGPVSKCGSSRSYEGVLYPSHSPLKLPSQDTGVPGTLPGFWVQVFWNPPPPPSFHHLACYILQSSLLIPGIPPRPFSFPGFSWSFTDGRLSALSLFSFVFAECVIRSDFRKTDVSRKIKGLFLLCLSLGFEHLWINIAT